MTIHVLCVKWGNKFAPLYVNRLHNMVQRHLTAPHQFVCLTDDPAGLQDGVRTLPLARDDLEFCWNKLLLFGELPLEGVALYFDLDVVITGGIDVLLTHRPGEPFLGIPDWSRPHAPQFNASVMRFEINRFHWILDEFVEKRGIGQLQERRQWDAYLGSRDQVVYFEGDRRYGGDQEWLSSRLFPPDAIRRHGFPDGWVLSYKRHGRGALPRDCRVMVFHGYPKMRDPDASEPWIREHWR